MNIENRSPVAIGKAHYEPARADDCPLEQAAAVMVICLAWAALHAMKWAGRPI